MGQVKDAQVRTGGRALTMDIWDRPDACGSPREASWQVPERAATTSAGAGVDPPKPSGKTSGTIVALFDMARVACTMAKPNPRWPHDCGQNANAGLWDLDNVTADVRKAKPTNNVQPVIGKKLIFNDRFTNLNAADSILEDTVKFTQGTKHVKDHKFSFKFGQKLSGGVKFKIPIGEVDSKLELETEEQWTDGESIGDQRRGRGLAQGRGHREGRRHDVPAGLSGHRQPDLQLHRRPDLRRAGIRAVVADADDARARA